MVTYHKNCEISRKMDSAIQFGRHESAVLTNDSKYITIISDVPCKERYKTHFSSSFSDASGKYLRGSRPMHRTTLTFEENPFRMDYVTSTCKAHSGKHKWKQHPVPNRCQSLHLAHFSIGSSKELDLKSQTMDSYCRKKLVPASQLHEGQRRWNDQVFAGKQMDKSLRYNGFEKVDHKTTYGKVHNALGSSLPRGKITIDKQPKRYNIISGAYIGPQEERSYRLKSGNKVLQNLRGRSDIGILG